MLKIHSIANSGVIGINYRLFCLDAESTIVRKSMGRTRKKFILNYSKVPNF